jgi:Ca-activated chloride channel family protein
MSLTWPLALTALALVPIAVWAYLALDQRRRDEASRFGNPALLPALVAAEPGRKRLVPPLLVLGALILLVLGLARPHVMRSLPKEEATVVLAMDTSRSMAAKDVKPTRLAAAERAAETFLDKVPDRYRVAIVSFSTKAEVVLPPTTDRDAARAALAQLRLGTGTAIGDAVARALSLVAPQPAAGQPVTPATPAQPTDPAAVTPASILLLSDGAQTAGGVRPLDAAKRAADLKIPVSTIALGTRDATVEVPLPGGLKQLVTVPPDPQTLRRVAQATGGRFFEAPTAADLDQVYKELGSRLGRERRSVEVTSVFAGLGAVLLLAAGGLSSAWFRRAL